MGKFIHNQNSFALGEISPEFFARGDLAVAARGLSRLENMDVLASGAISRRPALARIAAADTDAVLIPFSISDSENYLLALSDGHIKIYDGQNFIQNLIAPWNAEALRSLQYAQRFGTMIFVHPDFQPQVLKKDGSIFSLTPFDFSTNDDMSRNMPFMKFDDAANIKITVTTSSMGNSFATFTTQAPFWTPENVNGRLLALNRQWTIYQYVSPTVIIVSTNGTYTLPGAPVSDWREAAFGVRRGWPRSITFHQDRLVFGGSREWPCGVWMSRVGDHHNFSVGTGLDDEAIFLTLLSSARQQICTVVSSDNLQILTTAGEWAISAKPLTPSTIDIRQHTSAGSVSEIYLPPQKIDRGTVFVSKGGTEIREMVLDELGENYNAPNLCALAAHLINDPVDLAYNDRLRQLFIVMTDGSMAVLNKNSALEISAWGSYKTLGQFKSVAVMNGETFVTVTRAGDTFIEKFDAGEALDSGEFGFSHTAAAMPLFAGGNAPKKIRVHKISARVLDTKSLFINQRRAKLPNEIYAAGEPGFSGDVAVGMLGTTMDTINPLWTITGSEPLPLSVLSIAVEGWYLI
ncbi:MAG: hypothetical protein FWF97_03050 [Alphaproteobacteria bacterium]|nr:hypothetical protein [Alphaproteobacteria bacterium]